MDGRVPPTVSTAVRRLREGKDAAGAGVGGEFFFLKKSGGAPDERREDEFALPAKKYADRRRPPFHFSRGGGFVGRPVDVATLSYPRLRRRRKGGSEVMAHLFAQTAAPGRRAAAMKNKKQKPPCRSRRVRFSRTARPSFFTSSQTRKGARRRFSRILRRRRAKAPTTAR